MPWFVTDHDQDDRRIRGPFETPEAAAVARREIERNPDEERNLWIKELEAS
jgi:hypothetical protein